MTRALFRCDASPTIGAGHAMRCLAAAETLDWASWDVGFLSSEGTASTAPALPRAAFPIATYSGGPAPGADLIVFDHYGINADEQRRIADVIPMRVAFDDWPHRQHDVDLLVDPTPQREAASYGCFVQPKTKVLTGPAYAQLRRLWREQRPHALVRRTVDTKVRRILVSMGATDPINATAKVFAAVTAIDPAIEIDVILGPAAPHLAAVRDLMSRRGHIHVDPPDLPRLVAEADLAIGAAGSSCFERACLGLPALIIVLADNQVDLAKAFQSCGAARMIRRSQMEDPTQLAREILALIDDGNARVTMSNIGASLVDGRGPQRLLLEMIGRRVTSAGSVQLRLAERNDEDWLLHLQTLPETRRFAVNPAAPLSDEHAAWMARTLGNPDRLLAIIECDGTRCGMIRLDRLPEQKAFEVSIAILPDRQGRGIATAALELARRAIPKADLVATVLRGNNASQSLFIRAGYRQEAAERFRNSVA